MGTDKYISSLFDKGLISHGLSGTQSDSRKNVFYFFISSVRLQLSFALTTGAFNTEPANDLTRSHRLFYTVHIFTYPQEHRLYEVSRLKSLYFKRYEVSKWEFLSLATTIKTSTMKIQSNKAKMKTTNQRYFLKVLEICYCITKLEQQYMSLEIANFHFFVGKRYRG